MDKYQNGKIYQILNYVTEDVYVGSTTQELSQRMADHRASRNTKAKKHLPLYVLMARLGVDNFYIELIEEYPCDNKLQLTAREGFYQRERATLNKRIEQQTAKERYVTYSTNNRAIVTLRRKSYEKKNKDKIRERKQIYYQNNKKEFSQRKKQYRTQNRNKLNEYQRKWRKLNKMKSFINEAKQQLDRDKRMEAEEKRLYPFLFD